MSDWVRKAITKTLKPMLHKHGFYRCHQKHFVRVRGYLVDNIGMQMSQYGSKSFYIHYYTNLACSAETETILSTYSIGNRIGSSKYDKIEWTGDTESNANQALISATASIEKDVLPWFEKHRTIESYALEMAGDYRTTYEDVDFLMALILSRKFGKPYDMIKQLANEKGNVQNQHIIDHLWEKMKDPMEPGVECKEVRGLDAIKSIRESNLIKLKLERFINS